MDDKKVIRAIANMKAVEVRIIEKLASSTTGAQAHIGLLSKVKTDLEALDQTIKAMAVIPAPTTSKSNKTPKGE